MLKELLKNEWNPDRGISLPVIHAGCGLSEEGARAILSKGLRSLVLFPVTERKGGFGSLLLMASAWPGYFDNPSSTFLLRELESLLRRADLQFRNR